MSDARRTPASFRDPAYDDLDRSVEGRLNLPQGLLASIRLKGERSNAGAVSSAGARSVYQIIPATRSAVLKKYGVDAYAGPEQAAMAAGYVLREGLNRNGGSPAAAVAEYHGGTDRRQHGPINRAYVARVTGTGGGGGTGGGQSTYDRARAQRTADREAESGPSLARVYVAYRQGKMAPEQAAQFEHDVNTGAVLLPRGGSLRRAPAAPVLPAGVVNAYNSLESGMTIEQRQQIDSDLHDGVVSLPRAAKLNPWRPMTTGENMNRQLRLGTRAVIEGVGDVGGLLMNPINTALNATGIPQRLTGSPLAMANDPSVNVADMMGLPKPQFDSERAMSAVERGATGGLVTYGLGSAASLLPGTAGVVGRGLASAPVTDLVSGGTGGGSAEVARQEGFGPVGQLVAAVVGGGAGVAGTIGAERSAGRIAGTRTSADLPASIPREVVVDRTGALTDEGQELVARHGFTPDEVRRAYDDAAAGSDPAPAAADRAAPPSTAAAPPDVAAAQQRVQKALDDVGRAGGRVDMQRGETITLDASRPVRSDPAALAAAEAELAAARQELAAKRFAPTQRDPSPPGITDPVPSGVPTPASAPTSYVRRYDGVDYPVEIVGAEQADAAGRVHVQVRGTDTGAVGFVPKDELFQVQAPRATPQAAGGSLPAQPSNRSGAEPSETAPPPSSRTAADRITDADAVQVPLTRGQATQDFATQDAEQTLRATASGDGDKARTFLIEQADKIKQAVTRFRDSFGSADTTRTERGQQVKDALRQLRDQGKAGINALYREAQAAGGDELSLDTSAIMDATKRVLVEADVPDAVKNVVRQEMARYGMIGKNAVTAEDGLTTVTLTDGRKVQFYGDPEPLTIGNAERFRQAISAQYTTDGPRKLSQSIKGALDEAVENVVETAARNGTAGPVGDRLRQARAAVVTQKDAFSAKDVVQRLIDWKKGTRRTDVVLPEHAIREVLTGEMSNLKRVKALLLSSASPTSRGAWRAVQAEGIGGILDKAYVANSNLGAGPAGTISGAKLNSEIIRFGVPKLKVLLDEQDFAKLMSLRRVIGEATIPIAGTTNPSGSAFKLMRFLTPMAAKFSGIPLAGPAIDIASGLVKQAKATAEANRTLAGMTQYGAKQASSETAGAGAASPASGRAKQADEHAIGFIESLVDAARSGRLTASVLASHPNEGSDER